jgi:CubicO group peptidase (beta-lactamase class C family)
MVTALAAAPSAAVPDGVTAYHALTYGFLVGELIRRVSGRSVAEFLAQEVAEPLGLDGLYIGAPADALIRSARLIGSASARSSAAPRSDEPERIRRPMRTAFNLVERALHIAGHPVDFKRTASALAPRGISSLDFSSHEVLSACIPAANGLFTARSLARMYAALAGGGAIDGVRLMSPETLARATEIQAHGYDQITVFKMRWRLGYHLVGSFRGVPRHAFGHFGWGGSGAWADPSRELAFAFVVNRGAGTPIGDTRILRLNTALLGSLRNRRLPRRAA